MTEGFKRSVYWNEHKIILKKRYNANDNIRILIDRSWQGTNGLFVLGYLNDNTSRVNSHRKYFLPRVEIKNYNIEIDGRNFYDQPIDDLTLIWVGFLGVRFEVGRGLNYTHPSLSKTC